MTPEEARAQVEQQRDEARREGARADKAAVLDWVLDLYDQVDGTEMRRDLTTTEASFQLSVTPTTVARLCERDIPGAYHTNGDTGDWRIPSMGIEAYRFNRQQQRKRKPAKLWKAPEAS